MGQVEPARAIEPLCMLWCIPGFLRNDMDTRLQTASRVGVIRLATGLEAGSLSRVLRPQPASAIASRGSPPRGHPRAWFPWIGEKIALQ